jgi:hypothetical protein
MGFPNIPDNEVEVIPYHLIEIFIIADMGGLQHLQMGVIFAEAIRSMISCRTVSTRALRFCCAGKTARQMTRRDYETYDYLIAMDRNNLRNMVRFVGSDPEHKVSLLMDHTSRPGDVADPWYTGEFEATWQEVLEGCTALLEELR